MSEYVRKDGIADIENLNRKDALITQEEAVSRPLALAGDAGSWRLSLNS